MGLLHPIEPIWSRAGRCHTDVPLTLTEPRSYGSRPAPPVAKEYSLVVAQAAALVVLTANEPQHAPPATMKPVAPGWTWFPKKNGRQQILDWASHVTSLKGRVGGGSNKGTGGGGGCPLWHRRRCRGWTAGLQVLEAHCTCLWGWMAVPSVASQLATFLRRCNL